MKNYKNNHIFWYTIFIIPIMVSSSLILANYTSLTTDGNKNNFSRSDYSITNLNTNPSLINKPKFAISSNSVNSLNFLFTGAGFYNVSGIAIDSSGNKYITGFTTADNLITKNAYSDTFSGGYDVFIAKISSTNKIIFSTYLGGNFYDFSTSIAIDNTGSCLITGATQSNDFPTKNAFQSTYGGGFQDAFVAKFNSTGGLIFSTFLGGNATDTGYSIAVDKFGNNYVTGTTYSSNFPTKNAFQSTYGGNSDVFVTKLNALGGLDFSTYLGGSKIDSGNGIAVDTAGNIYITGMTTSNNFSTKNAFSNVFTGTNDAFVTKFNTSGSLEYSTYLGGNGIDEGNGIAVDTAGNAYITGTTSSTNFPTKHAFDSVYGGNKDAFMTKFNTTGNLQFSTYIGGSDADYGNSIAIDSAGNVFMTGSTTSSDFSIYNIKHSIFDRSSSDFLIKFKSSGTLIFSERTGKINSNEVFGIDSSNNCYLVEPSDSDVYNTVILKLDPKGNLMSTYFLNGHFANFGTGVALDKSGNIYITGETISFSYNTTEMSNQTTSTYNTTNFNSLEIFVVKLDKNKNIVFITYLGGNGTSKSTGIAVDTNGNVYITGSTSSTDFPTKNAFNSTYGGGTDAFIAKLSTRGELQFCTFLGGSGLDSSNGIAVDGFGNVYVTGTTSSNNFPTKNAYNNTYSGNSDAFVAEFSTTGQLEFSTYLGGSGVDKSNTIAVDVNGNSYITGSTSSENFPVIHGHGVVKLITGDFSVSYVFVSKFNKNGNLILSTYLGGQIGSNAGLGIAIDSASNIYITGHAYYGFPATNAYQSTYGGGTSDAFVTKLTTSGNMIFSTYIGGTGNDLGLSIAVDNADNSIYVTGTTTSSNFPIMNGFNLNFKSSKSFVTKFSSNGELDFSSILNGNSIATTVDNNGTCYIVGTSYGNDFNTKNTNYNVSVGGSNAFITAISSSGSIVYSSYIDDSFLLGMHENGTIQNTSQGLVLQLPITSTALLFGCVTSIIIIIGGIYTGVEYRKYMKIKKNSNRSKTSFKEYLRSKFTKSRNKLSSKPNLSKEVFEKLEEIEKENAPKE